MYLYKCVSVQYGRVLCQGNFDKSISCSVSQILLTMDMNTCTSSNNCSSIELWLMVACDGLAILIGVIALVMVVYLKLYLKQIYRLVLYQVVSLIISSVMWIACGFVFMYKGKVCSINTLWVRMIYFLALWLGQLQFFLAHSMVIYLLYHASGRHEMPKTMCNCRRSISKLFYGYKYSADVVGISLSIMLSTVTVMVFFSKYVISTNGDATTAITVDSYTISMCIVLITSLVVIIFVLATCILSCKAEKEMKIQFKILLCQLSPLLGYPGMFIFTILLLTFESVHIDGLSISSWISIAVTASIWCCANNVILTVSVTTILCIRRKVTPRIASPEMATERLTLNYSTVENIKSTTYFSIPVED